MALSSDPADPVCGMTSGDVARLLDVDLKTIHRWVQAGHLNGRRTSGRHLRFHRTEVVRFMRRAGYVVPPEVIAELPRVIAAGFRGTERRKAVSSFIRAFEVQSYDNLFDAGIAVASGWYEVLVIELRHYEPKHWQELLGSLRSWPTTAGVALLGISPTPRIRVRFVQNGGDAAIAAFSQLRQAVRWLTGSSTAPRQMLTASERHAPRRGTLT